MIYGGGSMLNLEKGRWRSAAYSVPRVSPAHLSELFLFQFLFIVLTDYKKAMPDGYLSRPPPSVLFSFFSKWVIVKQFMYSLSACVFIGGSELGLKPSPEVVFETWKEAPTAQPPTTSLSSPPSSHFAFLFLSLRPCRSVTPSVTHSLLQHSCHTVALLSAHY